MVWRRGCCDIPAYTCTRHGRTLPQGNQVGGRAVLAATWTSDTHISARALHKCSPMAPPVVAIAPGGTGSTVAFTHRPQSNLGSRSSTAAGRATRSRSAPIGAGSFSAAGSWASFRVMRCRARLDPFRTTPLATSAAPVGLDRCGSAASHRLNEAVVLDYRIPLLLPAWKTAVIFIDRSGILSSAAR